MTVMTPESDFSIARWSPRMKLPVDAATYSDIQQFLHREAMLLDNDCYYEWSRLLTQQINYSIDIRKTLSCESLQPFRGVAMEYNSLRQRLAELAECPTDNGAFGRIRRIISNVSACFCEKRSDFEVSSYLLLTRADETLIDQPVLNAERHDCLRRTTRGFVIFRREVIVDAARCTHVDPRTLL